MLKRQVDLPDINENEVDGIEILAEMAQSGKIDPWNIDIADVTDKFLQKLVEMKANNLKLTGRTLFFAALLLRLKSDILEGIKPFEEDELEEFDFSEETDDDAEDIDLSNVVSIDEVLERRTSVRLHRERAVTLEDLIRQLEFYEKLDRKLSLKNKQRKSPRRTNSYEKFTAEDIVNMAHDEYIDRSITHLKEILEKLFRTDDKIEITELQRAGLDKVSVYIALLFLASRSRIELVQDEFYSELYVVNEQ